MPVPSGAAGAVLDSVSCSAPDGCTAVGGALTDAGEVALAERWNGFAWVAQTVPGHQNALFVELDGVSCPSASACTAVGVAGSQTSQPVAEFWNGTHWKPQPTPSEPGGSLGAVSCPAADSCTAVGFPGSNGSPARSPRPENALPRPGLLAAAPPVSSLGAVAVRAHTRVYADPQAARQASAPLSAPSAAMYRPLATVAQMPLATAAGTSSLTLAEHWDGTTWTVESTPGFSGAAFSQAYGVSCGAPHLCFATGYYIDNRTGDQLPLLERWNGAKWTIEPIPVPADPAIQLFDVSCTAADACMAVGEALSFFDEQAFADRWNGTSWKLQAVPGQSGLGSALGSVSCTNPTACTAVGALLNNQTGVLSTLAEFWNGSTWSIQPTVDKSNASSYLYGVSCGGVDACMAVGGWNSTTTFAGGPLAQRWTGTAWHLSSLAAAPPHTQFTLPDPVSCSGATSCTAVGSYFTRQSGGPVALHWNASGWSQQSVPSTVFDLLAVSCLNDTACLATGDLMSAVWSGTSWSAQPLADPPVGNSPSLGAVSCSSETGDCIGVGTAFAGQPIPLAEQYS